VASLSQVLRDGRRSAGPGGSAAGESALTLSVARPAGAWPARRRATKCVISRLSANYNRKIQNTKTPPAAGCPAAIAQMQAMAAHMAQMAVAAPNLPAATMTATSPNIRTPAPQPSAAPQGQGYPSRSCLERSTRSPACHRHTGFFPAPRRKDRPSPRFRPRHRQHCRCR
jgi:hypothetical protein